tara:strand:- start:2482 stop:3513 length:1032 start_codon:yes stop_codon:yes gene_type:complete
MSSNLKLLREYSKEQKSVRWHVYYEIDTGDVVTVTNREKEFITHPFIVTDDDNARQILMGHVDPKKFAVVDINAELRLVEKSAVIRIKSAENKLSIVPSSKSKADVNIIFYANNWKMEVNFNQDTLYRMTGKRFFRNISVNPESDNAYDKINLYLIKDNDPNYLVKTIEIDPAELIEEGYILFDMTPLRRICNLTDVTVMTRKIFQSYRLDRRANFTGVDYRTRFTKRRTYAIPTPLNTEISSDFTIFQRNGIQFLQSNFKNPQDQKIYTDIGIYLTDPKNPNNLLGTLTLPLKDIGWESVIELDTDIDLLQCGFLCRESSNDLTFDFIENMESTHGQLTTAN